MPQSFDSHNPPFDRLTHDEINELRVALDIGYFRPGCESASNLDPTPMVRQIVETEAEFFISELFDRRPTVTPSFSQKTFDCNALQ
jgi:signal-transduction protein with cAMP-binding, CBS, and nucleotidyltransferase domain